MSFPEHSNHNNYSQVMLLDHTTNIHIWLDKVTNKIREKARHAAAHLDTGVEPNIGLPDYEIRKIVGRKASSNVLIIRGELSAEDAKNIPVVNFVASDKGTAFDEEDRYYYYSVETVDRYRGSQGKAMYDAVFKVALGKIAYYENQEKAYAWTVLEANVDDPTMSQVRIPPAEYEAKRSILDYHWLKERIKFIHTGEGAHSVTLEVMKLLGAQMDGDKHREYNSNFTKNITAIMRRNIKPDVLLPIIINTAYHYGLRGNGNHFYTHELNQLLAKPELPSYEKTMGHMTTLFTALRGIDEYANNASNGVVQANVAQTRFQKKPPARESTQKGSSGSSGEINTVYGDMCLNCAKKGHIARNCSSPPNTCDICKQSHHTSLHHVVQKVKDRRKMKPSYKPVKRSTSQMIQKTKMKETPYQDAFTAELEDEEWTDSMERQITDMERIDANIAESGKGTTMYEDDDEEYDDEYGANYSTVDGDINGYTLEIIDMASEKRLDVDEVDNVWNNATPTVQCFNTDVSESVGDIIAAIDSACSGTLIDIKHINDPSLSNVRPCHGVGIRGIDRKAAAIPATYVAKHRIVGTSFLGEFKNLISVSRMFDSGHSIDGQNDHIHIRNKLNNEIVLTGVRDKGNMFVANISIDKSKQKTIKSVKFDLPDTDVGANRSELVHDTLVDIDVPLSSTEIQRAKEAREYHRVAGHPRDAVLKAALTNRLWQGVDVVPRDVDNSNRLLGPCTACLESKLDAQEEPDAMSLKHEEPGNIIYFDTKPMSGRCLGGHVHALVGSDGYTGHATVNGMRNKLVPTIIETIYQVIAYYRSYSWTVKQLVFDRDPSFMPLEHKFPGILVTFYPAGMKNKVAERAIQDLCQKRRCMLNSLPFDIPQPLELKSYEAAAKAMSMLPNSKTGPTQCSHFLVTKLRTELPAFSFGTCVLAHARSSKDHDQRAEYGMYVDKCYGNDHLVYNVANNCIVSRSKVVRIDAYPRDWGLIPKPRLIATRAAPTVEDIMPSPRATSMKAEEMSMSLNTQSNPVATAATAAAAPT